MQGNEDYKAARVSSARDVVFPAGSSRNESTPSIM